MKLHDAISKLGHRLGVHVGVDGKCMDCGPEYAAYMPYGGATSFEQAEQFEAAQRIEFELRDLAWKFDSIVSNIMNGDDVSLEDKADRVAAAARELRTRVVTDIRAPMADMAADVRAKGQTATWKSIDAPGGPYWVGVYTNNLEDRQGEWFTRAAINDFNERAAKSDTLPELRVWHVPGAKIGEVMALDVIEYPDGPAMGVAFGRYDSKAYADAIEAWPEPLGMSHGFLFKAEDRADKTFDFFHAYELSVVPLAYAANAYTAHVAIKGDDMANQQIAAMLEGVLGADKAKSLLTVIDQTADAAKASGLASKSTDGGESTTVPGDAAAVGLTEERVGEIIAAAVEPLVGVVGTLAESIVGMKAIFDNQQAVIEDLVKDHDAKAAELATPRNIRSLANAGRGTGYTPSQLNKDGKSALDEIRAGIEDVKSGAGALANVPEHLRPYAAGLNVQAGG